MNDLLFQIHEEHDDHEHHEKVEFAEVCDTNKNLDDLEETYSAQYKMLEP